MLQPRAALFLEMGVVPGETLLVQLRAAAQGAMRVKAVQRQGLAQVVEEAEAEP
jgi:hypothetical protein